ncbi:HpcH/HpaI aldolase/citrate lyase family protein [Segniliparus rugosus]|uniref:HpcH/HpaI aldolase/citrate lyase domain-containing protein n=1 Tax=Segniliparus rugosus (strain ATCC BAA-974 / DSM 45345 / CCUG 50838 / CIP 108380 / JCM 13579 / CDC 945) TaxID=679197 RepID=U1M1M9_SEGRC|nr:CoA ester lyase [Segniliparus rugosus]ERG69282.1 hypothetical protein HMPREF9336_04173 [Segniliparus rugosus ATCC BAA-974]
MTENRRTPGQTGRGDSGLLRQARTWLFVPGDRPERFAKAAASGAQIVIIDLEDAVAAERKEAARAAAVDQLRAAAQPSPGWVVRANDPFSPEGEADLAALAPFAKAGGPLLAAMTPKAVLRSVARAAELLGPGARLVALIESALGVEEAFQIASHPHTARLAFGALDYAADVGASPVPVALGYAESRLVNASAAAGLAQPLARPTVELDDVDVLTGEVAHARTLGFGGKLCLHPKQVAAAAAGFAPTQREIDWAKRVVAGQSGGAVRVEGEMVDAPQVLRARTILAQAQL